MTKKTWIIFGVLVVALFGGLIYLSGQNGIDVADVDTSKVQMKSEKSGDIADHTFGNPKAKITLVEYGDYQCPGCANAYQTLKDTYEKYEDSMVFVFRNYPLTTMHPNAKAAAAAAEAAGLQGKYWQMHDLLYQDQTSWQDATATDRTDRFVEYAKEIGLSESSFRETLKNESERINQKISFDQALGKKIGVSGTPAIYINGKAVHDLRVKDGKAVTSTDQNLPLVWSSVEDFEKYVILPAFKEAGVKLPKDK